MEERIAAPLQEGEDSKSFERYLHWLGFTLNQKLCILELGVGFVQPQVIRFPFEKTCYFNQKSVFHFEEEAWHTHSTISIQMN